MKKKPHRFLLYLLLRAVMALVAVLPRRVILWLAEAGAGAAYFFLKDYREDTFAHLKMVFGREKSDRELRRDARAVFSNVARAGADWVKWGTLSAEEKQNIFIVDNVQLEKLKNTIAQDNGVIILASHIGNWELLGAFLARHRALHAVARRIYYPPFNNIIVGLRSAWNVHTVYRDEPPKKMLEILGAGDQLGILADQDVDSADGIFVSFFDRPTFTPTSPVRLARIAGAPLQLSYCVREGDRYRIILDDPIYIKDRENREETVRYYTQAWQYALEQVIRKYPDQWVWMHDRWKTQPVESVNHYDTATAERARSA